MGTWGTSLYDNDTACDIRGDYIDKLRRGRSDKEATEDLIILNQDIFGDLEEESLFWFALADTQWNYGRLDSEVQKKALEFISLEDRLIRFDDSDKCKEEWERTLLALKEKLEKPQPPKRRIQKYRLYRCEWKLGDVFAYRFESEQSKKFGFFGKYIVFRKISENCWYPGHIIPVVQVYKWIGNEIPTLDFIKNQKLLQQGFFSTALKINPNYKREFSIQLLSTSEKVIPKEQLYYLGSLQGEDLIQYKSDGQAKSITAVCWEGQKYNNRFEKYMIEMYLSWKDID